MKPGRGLIALVGAVTGSLISATPAGAAPTLQATAAQVSAAVAVDPSQVTGAVYTTLASPNAAAVFDTNLTSFPTDGATFGVLSSGDAENVDEPGTFTSVVNGGGSVRGNTDLDVAILRIDVSVPSNRNCLSVDFQFLSEEFPNFVGGSVNDAFVAELDSSTWTTEASEIVAPGNFAFGPDGTVISINSTGIAGMSAANGAGTAFDGGEGQGGATQLLRASTPITPGAHSVYLSIFDQGDQIFDSAVFLDKLFLGTAPEGQCEPGAALPPEDPEVVPPPTPPVGPPPIVSHCDPVSLSGTAAGDKLTGTAGADRIRALAGRDVLDGLAGDDQLCGGDGGDYVYGRVGADTLRGEGGNDRLYGSRHGDALEGGPGHDALIAGKGADAILATDGAQDCILTGQGADTVAVDPGLDLVDPKGGCPAGFWL